MFFNFNLLLTKFQVIFIIFYHLFKDNGYIVGWGKPYLTSKQMCQERFQILLPPETYCQSNIHTVESIRSWTNVFRAETEAKLTQGKTINNMKF